jgi:hypothetical protein
MIPITMVAFRQPPRLSARLLAIGSSPCSTRFDEIFMTTPFGRLFLSPTDSKHSDERAIDRAR